MRSADDLSNTADDLSERLPDDTAELTPAIDTAETSEDVDDNPSIANDDDTARENESQTQPNVALTDAVWRYQLDVLAGEAAGSEVWQGTDPLLGRKVGVRLLPASDERADDLREAACLAARISDRRLVHVLDVVDVKYDGQPHVAVVTEWVAGRSLEEVLAEPMSSPEALRLSADVAECLAAAHSAGIAHGRLRPQSVLITDNGDVRVRGIGVDAVLNGCDPDPDPATSDINAVGGLLYACTTGRWPYGPTPSLAEAPQIGGSIPLPSRVAPSVSTTVDSLCSRTVPDLAGTMPGTDFTRMSSLAAALRTVSGAPSDPQRAAAVSAPARRISRRLVATVLALLAVSGLAILGWQLLTGGPAALTRRTNPTPAPLAGAVASAPAIPVEQPIPVIKVSDYDPLGNGNENSELVSQATDRDAQTAWLTENYSDDHLSGKSGVGLLLDLGASRPVSAVTLGLVGQGTDVEIRTSDQVSDDPAAFTKFAAAAGAPSETTLRAPKPVTARYLLIWITRVPSLADGGYQGGIRTISVLS
jgi:serine/threonine protein kinase